MVGQRYYHRYSLTNFEMKNTSAYEIDNLCGLLLPHNRNSDMSKWKVQREKKNLRKGRAFVVNSLEDNLSQFKIMRPSKTTRACTRQYTYVQCY